MIHRHPMKIANPSSKRPIRPDLGSYQPLLKRYRCLPHILLHVDPDHQELHVFLGADPVFSCAVSTSRLGLGETLSSLQTPRGLHRVCTVFGRGQPLGRVFQSRRARKRIWAPSDPVETNDLILSRILWLDGLEPGINRGGQVDSRKRYIYLHGTNHEAQLGSPASAGCVRLGNQDIIDLTDRWIEAGALCLIRGSSS